MQTLRLDPELNFFYAAIFEYNKRGNVLMNSATRFSAPWGGQLKALTAFAVLLLVGIAIIGIAMMPEEQKVVWIVSMIVLPLAILAISALFTIRGYQITRDTLYIQRLIWNTAIDLENLEEVVYNPDAMKKSIRTFGNGGMFAFCGMFWNKKLGKYRVFGTDLKSAVVLKLKKRIVVITPESPDQFVARIKDMRGM